MHIATQNSVTIPNSWIVRWSWTTPVPFISKSVFSKIIFSLLCVQFSFQLDDWKIVSDETTVVIIGSFAHGGPVNRIFMVIQLPLDMLGCYLLQFYPAVQHFLPQWKLRPNWIPLHPNHFPSLYNDSPPCSMVAEIFNHFLCLFTIILTYMASSFFFWENGGISWNWYKSLVPSPHFYYTCWGGM